MMKDTIYRQMVIDEIEERINAYSLGGNVALISELNRLEGYILHLSSAQSEIVRCKDCKHRDVENGLCEGRGWPMQLVPDDGFCDKGKRR